MSKFSTTLVLIIAFCGRIYTEKNEVDDVFVPTHQWQVVKEGQAIPKGLHVRINLQTGLKEAKLLEEDEENDRTELSAGIMNHLLEMQPNDPNDETIRSSPRFRSYETIKEELGDIVPKTDAEILHNLLSNYKNLTSDSNVNHMLAILEDLEYLAHQFDNAIEFVSQNGFEDLILKNLNRTETEVLVATLKLLGALVQNNAKVQIHALETGCVQTLTRIMSTNPAHEVKTAATFALGCVLRRFPLAQKNFVVNGGLDVINRMFDIQDTKLRVKFCTLMDDLVQEFYDAVKDSHSPDYRERVYQYAEVDLVHRLEKYEWCEQLHNVLLSLLIEDRNDHDSIEKVLKAVHNMADSCSLSLKGVVSGLEEQYIELSKGESDDEDYFKSMRKLCWDIIAKLNREQARRTEL